ncbi:MAG: DUF362 domain-containing protein [Coriobacteriaceae bacterium]|jgi:uncharacterized Fe-S center protein|nr:DUF362 domain-containing protein [Coriobacteriaceae bacterium]
MPKIDKVVPSSKDSAATDPGDSLGFGSGTKTQAGIGASSTLEPSTSKVYFASLRLNGTDTIPQKLRRLIEAAGIKTIDFDRKFTAIKMHFGEYGNLAYLRPNYARVVVDLVRECGGRPFLTDSNTLYPGRRKNALEHLELAYEHGFSPFSTGCHIIIGDGLAGTDEALIPLEGGTYIKEAKIGRAVMDADVVISLTHFKGHIEMGFGGALKNIGMGCASRAGKMEMHSATEPLVDGEKCIGCEKCSRFCESHAITYADRKAHIDPGICVGCGHCIGACPTDAIHASFDEKGEILDAKVAEYTKAVLAGRPHFHISLVIDVSPLCDCWRGNDAAIVPNVGMFASFDPVALDLACADAVNSQPAAHNSLLEEMLDKASQTQQADDLGAGDAAAEGVAQADHFKTILPKTNWRATINHAVDIGLGNDSYELIVVP